jgi:hypothetical protein
MVPCFVRWGYHATLWTPSTIALYAGVSSIERLEGYLTDSLAAHDGWYLGHELNIRERVSSLLSYTAPYILRHLRSVLSNLALVTYP